MRTLRFATTISRCVNVCCLPRAAAAMEPVPHGRKGRDKWTASWTKKNAHFEEWPTLKTPAFEWLWCISTHFSWLGCQDSQHLLGYRRGQARKLDVLKDVLGVIRSSCLIKVGQFWHPTWVASGDCIQAQIQAHKTAILHPATGFPIFWWLVEQMESCESLIRYAIVLLCIVSTWSFSSVGRRDQIEGFVIHH